MRGSIYRLGLLIVAYLLIINIVHADELSSFTHIVKGSKLENQGKLREAIAEYEKAINEDPNNAHAYISLANIYQYKLMDKREAIEIYKKGLMQVPNYYEMHLNIMHAYFDENDIENGIKHYELLSRIRTEKNSFSFQRSIVDQIIKNMSQSSVIAFCRKYLEMNPTDTILREYLIDIYKEQGDYGKAKIEVEAMLTLDDKLGDVHFDLGSCLYNLGQKKEALKSFQKAQNLGMNVPQVIFEKLHKEIAEEQ